MALLTWFLPLLCMVVQGVMDGESGILTDGMDANGEQKEHEIRLPLIDDLLSNEETSLMDADHRVSLNQNAMRNVMILVIVSVMVATAIFVMIIVVLQRKRQIQFERKQAAMTSRIGEKHVDIRYGATAT